jgi:hypothetical protein
MAHMYMRNVCKRDARDIRVHVHAATHQWHLCQEVVLGVAQECHGLGGMVVLHGAVFQHE